MKRLHLVFSECEHMGDLDYYAKDVGASGGKIIKMYVDNDDDGCTEEGHIIVEVTDKDKFMEAFKETDAFGFSNYS